MEIWKDVPGYEGYYQISDRGGCRRIKPYYNTKKGGILRPQKTSRGYLKYSLSKNNQVKQIGVHQLVMLAFVGPPATGYMVNHKDGDKAHNSLDNLEYVTLSENMLHAHYVLGANPARGSDHCCALLREEDIPEIFRLYRSGKNYSEIAERYPVRPATIGKVIRRESWGHVKID